MRSGRCPIFAYGMPRERGHRPRGYLIGAPVAGEAAPRAAFSDRRTRPERSSRDMTMLVATHLPRPVR